MTRTHNVEALLEFGVVKSVCDDALDRQATLGHHHHLVPGFVHLTAVDTLDVEAFEHHVGPVDAGIVGHDAQHGDVAAIDHLAEHVQTYCVNNRSLGMLHASMAPLAISS